MKDKSYISRVTRAVQFYRAYEEDFKSPGDFLPQEDIANDRIDFVCKFMIGGSPFRILSPSEDGPYHLIIKYRSKKNVELLFSAYSVGAKAYQPIFQAMKGVAKKFYLRSEFGRKRLPLKAHLKWEEVLKIIEETKPGTTTRREALSWSKTMTVEEAKELFKHMKLYITFPSS